MFSTTGNFTINLGVIPTDKYIKKWPQPAKIKVKPTFAFNLGISLMMITLEE